MFTSVYSRTIEFGDCDPAQIVWNPRFFAFADHGMTVLFVEALGMPLSAAFTRYGISGLPLVQTEATFQRSVSWGEEVQVETTVLQIGRSSIRLRHRVLAKGEVCAEITGVRVWTAAVPDHPGQIIAVAIPEEVRAALA